MYWRSTVRSEKAWVGLLPALRSWRAKVERKTVELSISSRRTPMRTIRRERMTSAKAITPKKNRTMSVSASRVSWLWLIMTRSYTCSMYRVGASISTLTTRLTRPTTANSRLKAVIAIESGCFLRPLAVAGVAVPWAARGWRVAVLM
ncbi:MAG: hypothetical protein EBY30_06575 [Rhodospirillales bacterium]|nr:hypothetical protein [Rhodospirillales bacterium]